MTQFLLSWKTCIYAQGSYSIIIAVVIVVVIVVAIVVVVWRGLVRVSFSVHSPVIETAEEKLCHPNQKFCLILMPPLKTQKMCDNIPVKVQQDPMTLEITRYYSNKTMLSQFFPSIFFLHLEEVLPFILNFQY